MLRKRLFCDAKPTLLPCKTAAFGMQNNRFCNTLMYSKLRNSHSCEKYLHRFVHKGGIFTNKECHFHNVKAALFFVLETCFTALCLLNQITS